MLSIDTCGVENKCLEDVRQRDDAHDAAVLIHHHQSMHLTEDKDTSASRAVLEYLGQWTALEYLLCSKLEKLLNIYKQELY